MKLNTLKKMKFLNTVILTIYTVIYIHDMFSKKSVFVENDILYTHHMFDGPLDAGHLEMMKKVKHIVFGKSFNQKFNLTPNILSVGFCGNYHQLMIPTPNLTTLTFGLEYKCSTLFIMSPCMKQFFLKNCQSHQTIILNKNLEILEMYNWYSSVFTACKYLKTLSWEYYNGHIILNLYMEFVKLGDKFNKKINITKNVIVLKFGYSFNQVLNLNKRMFSVDFGCCFNHRVVLPKHLADVNLSKYYKHRIVLTPYIKTLKTEYFQCGNFVIDHPNVNTTLKIFYLIEHSNIYNVLEWLPHGTRCVQIMCKKKLILNNLPRTVQLKHKYTNCLLKTNSSDFVKNIPFGIYGKNYNV